MIREPDDLAARLADMARTLLRQRTVQDTLDAITELAVEIIDPCDYAGILVADRHGRIVTTAASHDLVEKCDALQAELREGPCFDALRREEIVEIADTGREQRWPRYTSCAARLGIGSALGFQLSIDEDDALGALNLYGAGPHAFGERSGQVGAVFAAQAAVALARARTEAQLKEAISTRTLIGEATGILMERHKLRSDEAFELLCRASQEANVKLREVARRVVETGEEPLA